MSLIIIALFFITLAIFIASAALCKRRSTRITFGVLTLVWSGFMFLLADIVTKLEYNNDFGGATKQLVDTSTEALKAGRYDEVSREFQKISEELDVSYEYKGNFSDLAARAAESLKN